MQLTNAPIIDDNNVLRLKLNPFQSIAHTHLFDEFGKLLPDAPEELGEWGGYGNGKSLDIMKSVYLLTSNYQNVRFLYARATGPQLEDSVITQFRELFPEDICGYRYHIQKKEARFNNGSIIFFRAFDGPRVKRILSTRFDGAAICQAEEVAFELYLQILGRLRGVALPIKIMLTEGNPDDTWPKDRYKAEFYKAEIRYCMCCDDNTDHEMVKKDLSSLYDVITDSYMLIAKCIHCSNMVNVRLYIEGKTDANKDNLPPDYINRLKNEFPEEWIERYVNSNWDKTSNKVHPQFNKDIHIIEPIPIQKHWFKAIGFDHGTVNPSAMVWVAVDEKQNLYVFDEFYAKEQRIPQLKEANHRHGPLPTPADYSMKRKERDLESLWSDLQREGLNLIEANKGNVKNANILLINQMFHQNRLFIFKTCENTIREIKNYRWQKPKLGSEVDRKEEIIKKDDHCCDALQYVVRFLKDRKVFSPTPYPEDQTLEYHVVNFDNDTTLERG